MDKQYIIAEIKRTALENGGIPLGRGRFATQTGIRIHDWSGRYWARWGDALLEAGCTPNTLQGAYGLDKLLECFVGFARELGHFPVDAELRMKATADKSFPSHTIWRSHFGSKQDLIKRVMDYCSARDDLADVAAMYKAVTGTDPLRSHRERAIAETNGAFGHVYLIRFGKYYKIGRSNATGRREYELAIQLPEKT
jgi:hypothetical protein